MSEDLIDELEDILNCFNYKTWKTKTDLKKKEWLDETYRVGNMLYGSNSKNRIIRKYKNYVEFEKYLFEHEEDLDLYLDKFEEDENLGGLFSIIESRLSVLKYSKGIKMYFFKLEVEKGVHGFFALPKEMYEPMNEKLLAEIIREKESESMFI